MDTVLAWSNRWGNVASMLGLLIRARLLNMTLEA
jgi:hypothetical protein